MIATSDRVQRFPSPDHVLMLVVHNSDVGSVAEVRNPGRRRSYVRMAAAVLLREWCNLSYPVIGQMLGYADHTTVLYGVRNWRRNEEAAQIVFDCNRTLVREMPEGGKIS